jgi:hypothetical protein
LLRFILRVVIVTRNPSNYNWSHNFLVNSGLYVFVRLIYDLQRSLTLLARFRLLLASSDSDIVSAESSCLNIRFGRNFRDDIQIFIIYEFTTATVFGYSCSSRLRCVVVCNLCSSRARHLYWFGVIRIGFYFEQAPGVEEELTVIHNYCSLNY